MEYDHHQIEESLKCFQSQLILLQYEGKPVLGRNLRDLDATLSRMERQLLRHFCLEERSLFPFLSKHIPKLEAALKILAADHCELLRNIFSLRAKIQHFDAKKALRIHRRTRDLKDAGVYFSCALRAHLDAEDRIVFHALKCDLKSEEKKQLERHFQSCTAGCSGKPASWRKRPQA